MMRIFILLAAGIFLLVSRYSAAQMSTSYDRRGQVKGYSEVEGDTTYDYGPEGGVTGFSEKEDDNIYDYTAQGKSRGYSVQEGGITYHYDKEGRMRGYSAESGHNTEEDDPSEASMFPGEEKNAFSGTSGGPFGVYMGKEKEK
jgi:hypothetical protein